MENNKTIDKKKVPMTNEEKELAGFLFGPSGLYAPSTGRSDFPVFNSTRRIGNGIFHSEKSKGVTNPSGKNKN